MSMLESAADQHARGEYVLAAGSKRGRVYSLNNRGTTYAEGVLRRTLE
jgi:hypothetical protein